MRSHAPSSDDVLAQAAPLIRATTGGIDDSGRIEDDPNAVGSELAATSARNS
jgi:hypothetical protein